MKYIEYQNRKISDTDIEMLQALAKFYFLTAEQLAALIGENSYYVKNRLKQLATVGLLKRIPIKAQAPAANAITKEGLRLIGFEHRKTHTPTLNNYEHSLGLASACTYLTLPIFGENKNSRLAYVEQIITEREFLARGTRDMIETGTKSNGQPIYIPADQELHRPDAYIISSKTGKPTTAIEFERTRKSTYQDVEQNVYENYKRFQKQFWFVPLFDNIKGTLEKIAEGYPKGAIRIIPIRHAEDKISDYVDNRIPKVISRKSGVPRDTAFSGKIYEPIALNKITLSRSDAAMPRRETDPNRKKAPIAALEA